MDIEPIISWSLVLGSVGVLVCVFKDAILSLHKTRRIRTFRWCIYAGGTNTQKYKWSRLVRVVVREGSIDIGGLDWNERELEVERTKLRDVRRVESGNEVKSSAFGLVEDFDKVAITNVKRGQIWSWVLLSWDDGNAVVLFAKGRDAAEFVTLVQEGIFGVGPEQV